MAVSPAHLRTLHEIARLGSFSRAADSLHLSQPAVSLHVRQLEDGLGLPLLERMGRRAALTRAGAVLLEHGGRALDALEAAAARVRALRGVVAGRVRVGTGATASIYLLPPILRRLRARPWSWVRAGPSRSSSARGSGRPLPRRSPSGPRHARARCGSFRSPRPWSGGSASSGGGTSL